MGKKSMNKQTHKRINVIFFGDIVNTLFKNELKFFNLSKSIMHSITPVKCKMNEPFWINFQIIFLINLVILYQRHQSNFQMTRIIKIYRVHFIMIVRSLKITPITSFNHSLNIGCYTGYERLPKKRLTVNVP